MSNSTEIILSLVKERKITKARLERECGLSNGTIHNWEIGKNNPSYGAIVKIANYFNVSMDYLLGKTDTIVSPTTEQQDDFAKLVSGLSFEEKEKVKEYIEFLRHMEHKREEE